MKKKITILFLMILMITSLTGCALKEKEEKATKEEEEIKWTISDDDNNYNITEDEAIVFEDYSKDLKPIVLLASKDNTTAYLAKETKDNNSSWKIVFVEDEDEYKVKSVKDFDLNSYFNKNISIDYVSSSYGWNYKKFKEESTMNDEIKEYFDKALEMFVGNSFTPIVYLGNNENDYLVFCYETNITNESSNEFNGYAVFTIHVEDDKYEISSIADIDLHSYEK